MRKSMVISMTAVAMLLTGQLSAIAAPPSQIVEEHLVAQAGLSIPFAINLAAQLFAVLGGSIGSPGCNTSFGGTTILATEVPISPTAQSAVLAMYFDNACAQPYFSENLQLATPVPGFDILSFAGHFLAPNGALLGDLSLAQQVQESASSLIFNDKGTYKAVAGNGQPPVRVGLACGAFAAGSPLVFTCQEGVAQDFPALKMALGTIANITITVTETGLNSGSVSVTGTNAKLATGKLGGLSIAVTSPTTLGFQGQATIVGSGSLSGASPNLSVIQPAGTVWDFNDSPHATKFSISTAVNLNSSGKVVDTATHATLATMSVDKTGTGTITYSDKSKAKITNWTLSD